MSELNTFLSFSPITSFLIVASIFIALSLWTWFKFSAMEEQFFSSSDNDCRDFVKESYSNPDAPLGNFKPPVYGPSRNVALVTSILGIIFLGVSSIFLNYSFLILLSLVSGLFFAQRLFWFDAKHLFLPDDDVYGFGLSGLAFGLLVGPSYDWHNVALTALAMSAFLWLIMAGFRIFLNKDGMGFGDVKLLMGMLPFLGQATLSHALFIASIIGILWWTWAKILEKAIPNQPNVAGVMPFGPFLILGWGIALINKSAPFLPW